MLAVVLMPMVSLVAPASPAGATEAFTLTMTEGELALRAADPHVIEAPTTVSGTNDDGQLSDVDFQTPDVHLVYEVPQYNATAEIAAQFSLLEAGSGVINEDGDVSVRVRMGVDLTIDVDILADVQECRTAPIVLDFLSTVPYDGEQVTLEAANFSIPEVDEDPGKCFSAVADAVDEALAGSGHRLTLTMAGEITPPVAGEPTATTLAVAPASGARLGEEVTLTAAVVADPAVQGAPAIGGSVTFYDGATVLGTVPVGEGGEAVLVTTGIGAGARSLQAIFSGAPPDWKPSQSASLAYTVTALPGLSTDLSGFVQAGGGAKDFTVTVANTGFGQDLADARLDVTIERVSPDPSFPAPTAPLTVGLDVVDGDDVAPVALTVTGNVSRGAIGSAGDWDVPVGEDRSGSLRLTVPAGVAHGLIRVTFAVVTDDDGDDVVLGSTAGEVTIHSGARQPVTLSAGDPGLVFPGPIVIIPPTPPVTPVARQGNVVEINILAVTNWAVIAPTGTVTFSVDGRSVPARLRDEHAAVAWRPAGVPFRSGNSFAVKLPADVPTGVQDVVVTYSGDGLYAPAQASWPVTVEPRIGTLYDCQGQGNNQTRFTANVEAQATVPGLAGRDGAEVERVEVRIRANRTQNARNSLAGVTASPDVVRELGVGPAGTLTAAGVTVTDNAPMYPGDGLGIDHIIDLTGAAGTLPVDHSPGDTVDYTLDRIAITATVSGVNGGIVCVPEDAPITLGSVTARGTTLAADADGPVREGTPVTLTADALPAAPGFIDFRDGTNSIAVATVDVNGRAVATVADLPAGTRTLTARFFSTLMPTSTSDPVTVEVVATDCAAFAGEGSAAVVRLVYIELLRRCPDQAGFDYWTGRLDGGTSAEVFARSIAGTPEAVGVVVDDGYRTMLGRRADAAGKAFWVDRMIAGAGRYDQLLADLATSGEFWTLSGETNDGFVTRVYDRLLHRTPDQVGLDFWVGRLDAGTSRRALVMSLANLDEPLRVLVAQSYGAMLDRAPNSAESTTGIAFLRRTGDRSGLYAQLIGRPEFATRAQTHPNIN